jgi:hypothetical protein
MALPHLGEAQFKLAASYSMLWNKSFHACRAGRY